jgi:hypothetical protein
MSNVSVIFQQKSMAHFLGFDPDKPSNVRAFNLSLCFLSPHEILDFLTMHATSHPVHKNRGLERVPSKVCHFNQG